MLDRSIKCDNGAALSQRASARGGAIAMVVVCLWASLGSSVLATSVDHPLLRHLTPSSRNARTFTHEQVLKLNYSSNGARLPAELCVAQHSAGQCSISDNQGDLWHDEIQPGQVRDRRDPMCHFSVTDGRHQHEDEGAMQLAVCSQYCRLCCRIQL